MALAPLAHVLFTRIMRYDASDPEWPDRDRFVLSAATRRCCLTPSSTSAGSGSSSTTAAVPPVGSATPGHPERGHTAGVEVTTGPLGQASPTRWVWRSPRPTCGPASGRRSRPPRLCRLLRRRPDGGISHEASSLAGHLGLGRLIAVYDDNHITIDGPTELALRDDAPRRFEAYGGTWSSWGSGQRPRRDRGRAAGGDGRDRAPSLVCSAATSAGRRPGSPTRPRRTAARSAPTRWRPSSRSGPPPRRDVPRPDDVLAFYRAAGRRGDAARREWRRDATPSAPPSRHWSTTSNACLQGGASRAGRRSCRRGRRLVAGHTPGLQQGARRDQRRRPGVGGRGRRPDRQHRTHVADAEVFDPLHHRGRQIHFGVREQGMAGVGNAWPRRPAALRGHVLRVQRLHAPRGQVGRQSRYKVAFVWSHDSVGLGEDAPRTSRSSSSRRCGPCPVSV